VIESMLRSAAAECLFVSGSSPTSPTVEADRAAHGGARPGELLGDMFRTDAQRSEAWTTSLIALSVAFVAILYWRLAGLKRVR
jgi:hypothetical protein